MMGWVDRLAGHIRLPRFMARKAPAPQRSPVGAGLRRALVPGAMALLVVVVAVVGIVALRQDEPASEGLAGDATANVPPTPEVALAPGAAGLHLSATLNGDGTLDVVERLLLSEPTFVLVLAVPPSPASVSYPASTAGSTTPEARDLRITADGSSTTAPETVTTQTTTVPLPAQATVLTLRYHLVGATVRSTPSAPGRALTSLAPIASPTEAGLPLSLSLTPRGSTILNVTCPSLGGSRAATCATENGRGWRTTTALRATEGYVLAQVDLAR